MSFVPKRRKVQKLMSKSINVFNGIKSVDEETFLESPLEADLCYHLEFDDKVKSYQAQPLSFQYYFEDKVHTYYPDFEVRYTDGTICYFEIKFIADIARIDNFEQWEIAVAKAAKKKGRGFIVLKEDFIRKKPIYENLQTLWAAHTKQIEKSFLVHAIQLLNQHGTLPIAKLIRNDSEFEQLYRLIFDRKLLASLDSDFLSKNSLVTQTGESYDCYL